MSDADLDYQRWPPEPRGGQHVRAGTGVIVVHRETGLAVVCESERSQHANRMRATERLREALADRAAVERVKAWAAELRATEGVGPFIGRECEDRIKGES